MDKITTVSLSEMKKKKEKIAVLTAYDYITAKILDEVKIDVLLVGDSAGMVYAGYSTTIPVGMEEMLYHTSAVARGVKRALIIGDMPFLSYQTGVDEAIRNAGRFLKAGAEGVKLEGGKAIVEIVKALVKFGIPVMGHLGLTPQSIHKFGGYKVQGKDREEAKRLLEDAILLEKAGCFSIVLEKIPWKLAKKITSEISIPTIGIGAGLYCDGQVLVIDDMLGRFEEFTPRFVKRYAEIGKVMRDACRKYIIDVKEGKFPTLEHSY